MNAKGALIAGPSEIFLYIVINRCLRFPNPAPHFLYSEGIPSFLNVQIYFLSRSGNNWNPRCLSLCTSHPVEYSIY